MRRSRLETSLFAPSPERIIRPGGFNIPVSATLRGELRWQVLDERGVPEVPRTPSGMAIGPAEGVTQSNLITDLGLDSLVTLNCFGNAVNVISPTWRLRLAVGTGSVAPAVTDTALANEVQRDNTSGSFPVGNTYGVLDTTNNVWRAVSLVTRLVTMNANRNLTEFGFAHAASDGLFIRELLRDGGGVPITVSLLNGKSIKIDHTLYVELPAPAAGVAQTINILEYDATDTLVDTIPIDIVHGGRSTTSGPGTSDIASEQVLGLFGAWNPYPVTPGGIMATNKAVAYSRTAAIAVADATPETGSPAWVWAAYTPGSHARTKSATFAAADLAIPWYGFVWRRNATYAFVANYNGVYHVQFVSPATYTKRNLDTLTVSMTSTWARV